MLLKDNVIKCALSNLVAIMDSNQNPLTYRVCIKLIEISHKDILYVNVLNGFVTL